MSILRFCPQHPGVLATAIMIGAVIGMITAFSAGTFASTRNRDATLVRHSRPRVEPLRRPVTTTELTLQARRQRETLLAISDAAVELFAANGFTDTTVQVLARTAGVSMRTFHRYFATKEDAVAPVLDAGWQLYVDAFSARPLSEPASAGLFAALAEAINGQVGRQHRTLLPSLPASPALARVRLGVNDRCATGLRPVLAARLGLNPDGTRARFAAACVTTANKLAVETWTRHPRTTVLTTAKQCIALLDDSVLQHQAE